MYGGAEVGGWCEREFQEETGDESVKVGWTRGMNGRQARERMPLEWTVEKEESHNSDGRTV